MDEDTQLVEDGSTSRTSLTRRKALGLGAVAVGGAALAGLVEASSAEAAVPGTTSLKAAVAQGATSITVMSTAGFSAGRTIWIGSGAQVESAVIQGVAAKTLKFTLRAKTSNSHLAGTRVSLTPPFTTVPGTFKTVVKKILNDDAYATAAVKSPQMITTDFPGISTLELEALRECAILSGADMGAINSVRGAAIAASGGGDLGMATANPAGPVLGFSPSCCCCCCCISIKF